MIFSKQNTKYVLLTTIVIVLSGYIFSLIWSGQSEAIANESFMQDLTNQQPQVNTRQAKLHYNEAVRRLNKGNKPLALEHIELAIQNDSHNIPAHSLLQDYLLLEGKDDSLITIYQDSLNNNLDDPVYIYLMGRLMEIEEGISLYENTVRIDSMFYWGYIGLGDNYLTKGEAETAKTYFEKALSINPAIIDAQYGLGMAFEQLGKLNEAERQLEVTLQINNQIIPEIFIQLGIIKEERADTTGMLEDFNTYLTHVNIGPEYDYIKSRVDSLETMFMLREIEAEEAKKKAEEEKKEKKKKKGGGEESIK